MKRDIIHTLWVAAALPLLLASCQQEELPGTPDTDGAQALSITVTDGGYSSDGQQTRAAENGYRTEFTVGDECGLYIVRGGTLVYSNIKLTATASADGSALAWQPEVGVTLTGGFPDENYFLYYPYQADMSGKIDASATDAGGFFAPLVSGWQPKADQSTYANYTVSDLMTAKGTATKGTVGTLSLSFSTTHRMAMVVIEMPWTVYRFTNTDVTITGYITASSADFTISSVKPYRISPGTYRCIANPANSTATSITGRYDEGKKEFTVTPNGIAANSYKTYKVDGAQTVQKRHYLQPGDFLLADGSLVGKDETLTTEQQATCIGIVFYAGRHPEDKSDYTGSGIGGYNCHGYAVALKDAASRTCMWGEWGTDLNIYVEGNHYDHYNNADIDWSGYNYTQTIINQVGGKDKLNPTQEAGYPATYYAAVAYENNCPAPANSSGWFLPAIGQMFKVYQQRDLLTSVANSSGLKDDDYWSSSEYFNRPAFDALSVFVYNGYVYRWNKNERSGYVRAVLAF